jgi:demethylmenaquinone methyltransferase/2-methoxy-6-polyprenyl-1,4-benzoquinol methylase
LEPVVVPYKQEAAGKKAQVARMFDNISGKYDFLNHFLSLGIDRGWRRRAVRTLAAGHSKQILDVATGTGDFAIECLRLNPDKVTGIDISNGMLEKGREKIKRLGLDARISLLHADSENMPFADNSFDAVVVAFGVRNFENLERGLAEMHRVLRPGGRVVVLEFSKPRNPLFRALYNTYFHFMLPALGRFFSRDKSAYTYLPESVEAFPDGDRFLACLSAAGFNQTQCTPLTFGISSLYTGSR